LPKAAAGALEQKDVVVVEVRADRATGSGVAHHEVVDTRGGNEGELVQQLPAPADQALDAVDEHGKVALGEHGGVEAEERAVVALPAGAALRMLLDQA